MKNMALFALPVVFVLAASTFAYPTAAAQTSNPVINQILNVINNYLNTRFVNVTYFNQTVTMLTGKIHDGDAALQSQLNTEKQERTSADQAHDLKEAELDAEIETEVDLREQGDLELQDSIDSGDAALQAQLESEASQRVVADNTMQNQIDSFFDVFS
jgi:hypothetical protein